MLGDLSLALPRALSHLLHQSKQIAFVRPPSTSYCTSRGNCVRMNCKCFVTAPFILALVSLQRPRNPRSWFHPLPLALNLSIGNFFRGGAFSDILFMPGSLTAPPLFLLIDCCANPSRSSNHHQSSKNLTTNQRTGLDCFCKFQCNFGPLESLNDCASRTMLRATFARFLDTLVCWQYTKFRQPRPERQT